MKHAVIPAKAGIQRYLRPQGHESCRRGRGSTLDSRFRGNDGCSFLRWIAVLALLLGFPALAAPLAPDSLYNQGSAWSDQEGRTVHLADLRGAYVLMAMIYTHCKDMCPMTIETMRSVLAARPSLHPVLVSFDSERDSAAVLKRYADSRTLEGWTLLRGDRSAVRSLAALLGVNYQKSGNGDFGHSNLITLLDPEGRLVHQQAGFESDISAFSSKSKE